MTFSYKIWFSKRISRIEIRHCMRELNSLKLTTLKRQAESRVLITFTKLS